MRESGNGWACGCGSQVEIFKGVSWTENGNEGAWGSKNVAGGWDRDTECDKHNMTLSSVVILTGDIQHIHLWVKRKMINLRVVGNVGSISLEALWWLKRYLSIFYFNFDLFFFNLFCANPPLWLILNLKRSFNGCHVSNSKITFSNENGPDRKSVV